VNGPSVPSLLAEEPIRRVAGGVRALLVLLQRALIETLPKVLQALGRCLDFEA
jgi:hypothetical protein